MEIKKIKFFRNTAINRKISAYLHTHPNSNKKIYLFSVAFNDMYLIKHQYFSLKKQLTCEHAYVVFDNSTDLDARIAIETFCVENQIQYYALPPNPFSTKSASQSHAISLNFIFYKYIKKIKPKYFAILDHDIFPIKNINYEEIFDSLEKQGIYGLRQNRKGIWYLWPGYCFFNYDKIADKKINFSPQDGGDTGAGNWECVYKLLNDKNLTFASPSEYVNTAFNCSENIQRDCYEIIDKRWLHIINASGWKVDSDATNKIRHVFDLMNSIE